MDVKFCKTCGAALSQRDAYTWECNYCHNVYSDKSVKEETERLLRTLISEDKCEKVANLRRNLYDALNAEYTDSEEIVRICGEIKALLPDDFMADFYSVANSENEKSTAEYINKIDTAKHAEYIEGILHFMLKSFSSEYHLPLTGLIERAYRGKDLEKLAHYSTLLSEEAEKATLGVYETRLARDVFMAYSGKDMEHVYPVVSYLEGSGLSCFVAARNLRHGRGAVQNYNAAIREAISNCKSVVFVSTPNSRSFACDALKIELPTIKQMDINNAPYEYKQNYASMPQKYKKPRVELRLADSTSPNAADTVVKEFFCGCEYAYTAEEVAARIISMLSSPIEYDSRAGARNGTSVKYCASCGTELPVQAKLCFECGGREFADTYKEYELLKRLADISGIGDKSKSATDSELPSVTSEEPNGSDVYVDTSYLNFTAVNGVYEVSVNGASSCPSHVIIPSTYRGKRVGRIGYMAFRGHSNIKSVSLPDTVTYIGDNAFSGCSSLQSISIPGNIDYVGVSAFMNCSAIKSVSLPDSVKQFGHSSFMHCSSLKSVRIPKGVSVIPYAAFENCTSLSSVYIHKGVTSIQSNAFAYCSALKEISFGGDRTAWEKIDKGLNAIPNKVNVILNSDPSVTPPQYFSFSLLPNGTYGVSINNNADCPEKISIPTHYKGKRVTEISNFAFSDRASLVSITIPEGITHIGDSAFEGCSSLSGVDIPASVKTIGTNPFCSIPIEGITVSRGNSAYRKQSGCIIESATQKLIAGDSKSVIPSSVKEIGDSAFYSCADLAEITLPQGVTIIGEHAFRSCEALEEITIPNGISKIGEYAFSCCLSLKSITLPDGLTEIADDTFSLCSSLMNVTIPASVTRIGERAFLSCSSLAKITYNGTKEEWDRVDKEDADINDDVTVKFTKESSNATDDSYFSFTPLDDGTYGIKIKAYNNCPAKITLPSKHNGKRITRIDSEGFMHCSALESITIPSSITHIGSEAFSYCKSLGAVAIPSSVCEMGENPFVTIAINKISIDPNSAFFVKESNCIVEKKSGRLVSGDETSRIPSSVTAIGDSAFSECETLSNISIPENVTHIGVNAFSGCNSLTSITVPGSVSRIEDLAFSYCSALESVTLSNGVTHIGESEFTFCSRLKRISIPRTVTEIGNAAFSACIRLEEIIFDGTKEEWDKIKKDKAEIPSSAAVKFTKKSEADLERIFEFTLLDDNTYSVGVRSIDVCPENVVFPSEYNGKKVTEIAELALKGFNNENDIVKSIIIPSSVTHVDDGAFDWCSSLTSITIPNSVTQIGTGAFSGCSSLTSITIPSSVTHIGTAAFEYCSSLTSITIPSSITHIGTAAFSGCSSLTSITIPDSVKVLEKNPFIKVPLSKISISQGNKYYKKQGNCIIETSTGKLVAGDETSIIPSGVTHIGDNAFWECSSLTSITIPSSVTHIGDYAFRCCSSLTSITIPDSVTKIGDSAFSGCYSLTSITIPSSVTHIGPGAFSYCSSLKTITFNGTKKEWKAISKGDKWKQGTGSFTVRCTDGSISKLFA